MNLVGRAFPNGEGNVIMFSGWVLYLQFNKGTQALVVLLPLKSSCLQLSPALSPPTLGYAVPLLFPIADARLLRETMQVYAILRACMSMRGGVASPIAHPR